MYDFLWNLGLVYLGIYIGRSYEKKTQDEEVDNYQGKLFDYSTRHLVLGGMPLLKRDPDSLVVFDTFKISTVKKPVEKKSE